MKYTIAFRVYVYCLAIICTRGLTDASPPWVGRRDTIAGGVKLRILPLGDSITDGMSSSDGNGYRLPLRNLLTPENAVEYIGHEHSGTMDNNNHEGYPGHDIGPIAEKAKPSYAEKPNVVLLMAGTNNIFFNIEPDNALNLLGNLIDDIVQACPDAAVLAATLTPMLDPENEEGRIRFNDALPPVIDARTDVGKHVTLVDMGNITDRQINPVDGVHPIDEGYQLMASVWYEAIDAVGKKGWIKGADSVSLEELEPEHDDSAPMPEGVDTGPENADQEQEQEQEKNQGNAALDAEDAEPRPLENGSYWTIGHFFLGALICAALVIVALTIRALACGGNHDWEYSQLQ